MPVAIEMISDEEHGFNLGDLLGGPLDAMSPLSVSIMRDDCPIFREGEDETDHFAGKLWKDQRVHLWGGFLFPRSDHRKMIRT